MYYCICLWHVLTSNLTFFFKYLDQQTKMKVKVGSDQEMVQSERKTLTVRYLY